MKLADCLVEGTGTLPEKSVAKPDSRAEWQCRSRAAHWTEESIFQFTGKN
jgi:hypothetical protein